MPNWDLKSLIVKKFGNQAAFARDINFREDRISKFIYGRAIPTEEEKETIARRLGVSPCQIFPDEDRPASQLQGQATCQH